VDTEGSFPGR